jgi:hypothetical protein
MSLKIKLIARALRAKRKVSRFCPDYCYWNDIALTRSATLKYCRANPYEEYDLVRLHGADSGLWAFITKPERADWEKQRDIANSFQNVCVEIDELIYKQEVLALIAEKYKL